VYNSYYFDNTFKPQSNKTAFYSSIYMVAGKCWVDLDWNDLGSPWPQEPQDLDKKNTSKFKRPCVNLINQTWSTISKDLKSNDVWWPWPKLSYFGTLLPKMTLGDLDPHILLLIKWPWITSTLIYFNADLMPKIELSSLF
jgi:hypothetical protein